MNNGISDSIANTHHRHMQKALRLAEQASVEDEVPVGAVIIKNNRIIGKGYNQTERLSDPTAHAEMIAISAACASLEEKYLQECTLYVTLEPCPMCAGAMVWSKLKRVVFGTLDENAGACGSIFNIASNKKMNHQIEIIQGILEPECKKLLQDFFKKKRL